MWMLKKRKEDVSGNRNGKNGIKCIETVIG